MLDATNDYRLLWREEGFESKRASLEHPDFIIVQNRCAIDQRGGRTET